MIQKLLADFVTERSKNLFSALSRPIDPSFLELDPETWDDYDGYITVKPKVLALRVVNDCAARAVRLATDFSQTLTHDETQRQLVFQIECFGPGLVNNLVSTVFNQSGIKTL